MADLLLSIAPLCVIAAVSPVVFLNASSALSRGGTPGAVRFLGGNLVVLLALGFASMGLLGAAAASRAEREIASRTVDRFLGLLLLCYGVFLLVQFLQRRGRTAAPSASDHGSFAGGVLGMATNFTTLPIFMSIGQRIGATAEPLALKAVLVVVAAAIVAAPAWLPIALRHLTRGDGSLSPRTRQRVSETTQIVSVAACILGALFLLFHGI